MRSLFAFLALSLPLLATAAPVRDFVVNGSFENTSLNSSQWRVFAAASTGGTDLQQPVPGWQRVSGPGIEIRNGAEGTAQHGLNFVELDSHANSRMSQAFDELVAGLSYQLSFFYSPRIGQPASTNGLMVFWNDVALFGGEITASGVGRSSHSWTRFETSVVAGPGSNRLDFAASGRSDTLGASLDNVRLTGQAGQAVSAPAALVLTLSALGALALSRRRNARR